MTKARKLSITQLMESRVPNGFWCWKFNRISTETMKDYSISAGRTIRAGAELERAAAMYAREPVPSMVLKSNGTALPADRIAKLLLDAWGAARRNRGTAFLNADVELTTVGFTPEQIGLNAAREIIATELGTSRGNSGVFY
jgi:hypothetical protein